MELESGPHTKPMDGDRAAALLATLISNQLLPYGEIDPKKLARFIRANWRNVSMLAHAIHAAPPQPQPQTPMIDTRWLALAGEALE